MAVDQVPASTKIRSSRVQFISTDRLQRRAAWLDQNKGYLARAIDGPDQPGGRNRLRALAREILTIDAELARRRQRQAQ